MSLSCIEFGRIILLCDPQPHTKLDVASGTGDITRYICKINFQMWKLVVEPIRKCIKWVKLIFKI